MPKSSRSFCISLLSSAEACSNLYPGAKSLPAIINKRLPLYSSFPNSIRPKIFFHLESYKRHSHIGKKNQIQTSPKDIAELVVFLRPDKK